MNFNRVSMFWLTMLTMYSLARRPRIENRFVFHTSRCQCWHIRIFVIDLQPVPNHPNYSHNERFREVPESDPFDMSGIIPGNVNG
jgi:hypothetical protein